MFRTAIDEKVNGMQYDTFWSIQGIPSIGQNMPEKSRNQQFIARININLLQELTSIYSPASTTIGVAIPVSTKLASLRSLHSTDRRIPKNIPE